MKKLFKSIFIIFAFVTCYGCHSSSQQKKIGIIVPLEHKAMNDIVEGFTQTLKQLYSQPVDIKVANAQGDMNIQRAIIQQMKDEHYDLIVPIGTASTQMTAAMIQHQAIVSLAGKIEDEDRKQQKNCNLAVVHDEISTDQIVEFIHSVYPSISKIVLIHSPQDKVFPEIKSAQSAGKKLGIEIKSLMINSLSELYSISNSIPKDTNAIFILKDHMVVSGIATLAMLAEKRNIPLISSDQGSVEDGSAFALGVHERDIGVAGAKLASSILTGTAACDIPIAKMKTLTVFINKASLTKEKQNIAGIKSAANKLHYQIEYVHEGNKS